MISPALQKTRDNLPPLSCRMTYAEFLEWDTEAHYEWVDGEAVWMGTVSNAHNDLGVFLIKVIHEYVLLHNLGIVRYEPFNMKTGSNLPGRNPDVLFLSNAHLDRLKKNHLEGPADLAVEIISPESQQRDRQEKFAEYEQGGVSEYWLLHPETHEYHFYQRDEAGKYVEIPVGENGIYASRELPGFRLNLDWLSERPSLREIFRTWDEK